MENDWFYSHLDLLVSNGIIKGKTPTSFEPDSTFSYAECSTVITRYLGLEDEAVKYQKLLSQNNTAGGNKWYSGYIYVMAKLKLFDGYGIYTAANDGLISIDTAVAESPIMRYRFAECISKSFELDGSLRAKNIYSEIGGLGHEFIIGGYYDTSLMKRYESYIADFEQIPENSRQYILKAYCNGIFCGDTSGNFYPDANLKRSEMSKVLAAIYDFSYRKHLITDVYTFADDDMYFYDKNGNKSLSYEASKTILSSQAESVSVFANTVSYCKTDTIPYGYTVDCYVYKKDGELWQLDSKNSLSDSNPNVNEFSSNLGESEGRVLLVLRNLQNEAVPESVMDIRISQGEIISVSSMAREM